ncbi:MAG: radical SAM protein [Clostridiales bacterium]|nr:radical SAM protein [Clostridiales bacterium]
MKHINVALFVPHLGCPHTCSFCNQRTISGVASPLTEADIDNAVQIAVQGEYDRKNSEIAFFGGSFTAVDRDYMTTLLKTAYKYVQDGFFKGIRCSTRPDAIDEDILCILKKYGVTAIELGAQSMSDKVLEMNERGHTAADVEKASRLIKEYGFELGLQMMTGLYGDSDEASVKTAEKIINLKPETVRIYPTVVLKNTALGNLYTQGIYKPQSLDEAVNLCSKLIQMFNKAGINVIRVGLHSGGGVEEGYLAGAYHPAFREMCESKIYMDMFKNYISEKGINGKAVIYVAPSEISKAVGQKKRNIEALKTIGVNALVKGSPDLKKYEFYIEKIN